jgi:hypothetical protein
MVKVKIDAETVASMMASTREAQLNALAREATIGYCRVEIVKLPAGVKFGKINTRLPVEGKVKELLEGMKGGYFNVMEKTAIAFGVRRGWIKNEVLGEVDGRTVDEVPKLELTEAGDRAAKRWEMYPYEGGHRVQAAKGYVEWLGEGISVHDERIKELREKEKKTEAEAKELEKIKGEVEQMRTMERVAPWWAIKLIDLGE